MGTEPGRLASLSLRACVYSLSQVVAAVRCCLGFLRATAFWGAILLPVVIVGVLLDGLATSEPFAFTVLVGLHVICLVLGQRHRPNE